MKDSLLAQLCSGADTFFARLAEAEHAAAERADTEKRFERMLEDYDKRQPGQPAPRKAEV